MHGVLSQLRVSSFNVQASMFNHELLHGAQVRLAALTSDDVPTIVRWHQDPTFLRLLDARPAKPRTEPEFTEWLAEQNKSHDAFVFAIRSLDHDDLLGYIELESILWTHGVGWVSYCIGDATQRGQGYGTEALQLALQFAFHELNLHRLQATIFNYNQPSIALLAKLGFQREGTYREFLQRDGRRHDMYLYGLLRREWETGDKERETSGKK
jgi:RimJ/RimL family protein N-acetyltransferase